MNNKLAASLIVCGAWYILLFPGRLGFDAAEAIRMVQKGQSTDWWSALFFWFIKISTLGGKTIAVASLLQIALLFYSCLELIESLPFSTSVRRNTLLFFVSTPFFGFFGLGISHDVFLTSGILLLLSIEFRKLYPKESKKQVHISRINHSVVALSLSMTKIGLAILFAWILISLLRKELIKALAIAVSSISILLISSLGISSQASGLYLWPAIADMKCIAQHKQAEITPTQWQWLESLANKEKWLSPISCSSMDSAVLFLGFDPNIDLEINSDFVRNYVSISMQNPAIVVMAHINRSRVALPPPFFPVPQNQVDLDINKPIGDGTNIALQTGPEVLHPSIDEPTMKVSKGLLVIPELILQGPTFIINQASWFWGWGGLWLWGIGYFLIRTLRPISIRRVTSAVWPILTLHLVLVCLAPNSLPRYVMPTIYCGMIFTVALIADKLAKSQTYSESERVRQFHTK